MIRLENLGKRFGPVTAVERVSLEVGPGELLFLVGGSGSGKTTTLKMVNRLIEPSEGRVLLEDRDVRELPAWELRRRIGYVFQRIGLFPHLSVARNVAITPSLLGWPAERIARRVDELLELVGLDPAEHRERMPAELSGGQQQRVGLARALAARPRTMLLDEPFGALDPITRDLLQQAFRRIHSELQITAIFVSHDMAEALLLADRIAVMREGRVVQMGAPGELLRRPADGYVAELMAAPLRQAEAVRRSNGGAAEKPR